MYCEGETCGGWELLWALCQKKIMWLWHANHAVAALTNSNNMVGYVLAFLDLGCIKWTSPGYYPGL